MKINKIPEEYFFLAALILIIVIANISLLSGFKQLPSPIYGGDYYFQLGAVNHVKYGGNPLEGSNMVGTLPAYFPLYSAIVGGFAGIFGVSGMNSIFIFSAIFSVLISVISFFLFKIMFGKNIYAFIGSVLFFPIFYLPVLRNNPVGAYLTIPLALIFLYRIFTNKGKLLTNAICLGISFGAAGLMHAASFLTVAASIFIFACFLIYKSFDNRKFKLDNKVKYLAISFAIGFLISLLYWYYPLFVSHGSTNLNSQEWSFNNFSSTGYQFIFLFDTIKSSFFNFSSLFYAAASILAILGLIVLLTTKKQSDSLTFTRIILVLSVVLSFHYFLSEPIFHTHFIASHFPVFILHLSLVCLQAIGLLALSSTSAKYGKYVLYAGIFLILLFSLMDFSKLNEDRWIQAGRTPMSPNMIAAEKWIVANTQVTDIFLSSNELSFALNALTGRKLLISRRAQNDPFMDFDPRERDAAVIFFGNDSAKQAELLKKYNIKYVYWDYYWINSEFQFDESGNISGWFDPLMIMDTPENRGYLEKYGVKYSAQNTWLDPSMKGDYVKKMDLLIIDPQYFSLEQPWNSGLSKYLKEVWAYTYTDGKVYARIYEVKA